MTTLHDRLADLAEDAPAAQPEPGLWDQGLRYRRRRRTGTAVVLSVAAVALVVLGSVTWLRSPSAVEPLPADSPGGMPDHLYAASRWLPGTDDSGPLGPIAALFPSARESWSGTGRGIVGVSATSGEYRFVDLPDLAPDDAFEPVWSLSPDGRYIAYLYRDGATDPAPGAATGIALYDTTTGDVRQHVLPSDLGVRVSRFYWTASDTVVLTYGRVVEHDGNAWQQTTIPVVWDAHVEAPHDLVTTVPTGVVHVAGPGFVELETYPGAVRVDPRTGVVLRRLAHRTPVGTVDGTGSRVAQVPLASVNDGKGGPVAIRTVPSDPHQRAGNDPVPGVDDAVGVYSWPDDHHVALHRLTRSGQPGAHFVVDRVDVHDGTAQRLVTTEVGQDAQLATDLLARPTVPGIEPPHPVDPRLVTAGGILTALAAGWALVTWRRRVRP